MSKKTNVFYDVAKEYGQNAIDLTKNIAKMNKKEAQTMLLNILRKYGPGIIENIMTDGIEPDVLYGLAGNKTLYGDLNHNASDEEIDNMVGYQPDPFGAIKQRKKKKKKKKKKGKSSKRDAKSLNRKIYKRTKRKSK
tara:strand:+ start:897 stop:1307 length:411 start_codon:yes stop_codon:yes gene_type:complete